ncbi:Ig-like domain-containing protein [Corynebacterium choanae]|uniref:L,D-transpeptidase LppS n=1 Tax=Corynebacterium choanae TaxID=1862358 RepID=A0A3G6J8C6_9CORY|nr:Ig-like domain-containing protein [Corynebacterium choanae]AZA14159.1 Putative L,D-transpeptidase LppS precursor [Corynebacterium choanae]
MQRLTRSVFTAVATLAAGSLVLAGCSPLGEPATGETVAEKSTTTKAPVPAVASVRDGATGYNPANPVTVKAVEGTLKEVVMTNQDGKVVQAEYSADRTTWTTAEDLGYFRTYTIQATTSEGATSTTVFDTITPDATTNVALSPLEGSTVGVGQTIGFRFGQPIEDREAAQEVITVTTNPPVEGAFYWLNDYELRWRPEHFWKPGTTVDVDVDLYGTHLGEGLWGNKRNHTSFTIGDEVIAVADDNTKTITISRNGQVINTMPTSMGRPDFATPQGTYIIGDQYPDIVMDSSTFGLAVTDPNGYRTDVKYATQMSYSGIFVHAAPWSVWAQGSQNTSHGCLNVSTENAKWFMDNTKRGDIVVVKNTVGGTLSGYDGLGDWNIPWETWKAGNATPAPAE